MVDNVTDTKSIILINDPDQQIRAKIKENENTRTSSVSNVSSSLVAGKTRSHWALALINVLASFSMIEEPFGETCVSFITLNREASSSLIELIDGALENLDLVLTVVHIGSNLDKGFIDIPSH